MSSLPSPLSPSLPWSMSGRLPQGEAAAWLCRSAAPRRMELGAAPDRRLDRAAGGVGERMGSAARRAPPSGPTACAEGAARRRHAKWSSNLPFGECRSARGEGGAAGLRWEAAGPRGPCAGRSVIQLPRLPPFPAGGTRIGRRDFRGNHLSNATCLTHVFFE